MRENLRELWQSRELVWQLVLRDMKLRYKNSVLGFFWSLLNPLFRIFVITVMVKYIFRVGIANYSAYLFCVFLPWIYFQMAVLDSCSVILAHFALVKKVYFPREALPISSVLSNLIHFFLALGILFLYFLYLPVQLTPLLFYLPLVIGVQTALILGISFIVSCLNVYFEDIKYIVGVLLNLMFYATPIMYPVEMVPARYYDWYMLNPLSAVISVYQKILIPSIHMKNVVPMPIDWHHFRIATAVSLAILVAGYSLFQRMKWSIAEKL